MKRLAGEANRGDMTVLHWSEGIAHCKVERGQQREADRTHEQAERIEPADGHRTEGSSHQAGDENHVLQGLPALVAIRLDALLAALRFRRQVAEPVLQGAHRADPATEEPAKKESRS